MYFYDYLAPIILKHQNLIEKLVLQDLDDFNKVLGTLILQSLFLSVIHCQIEL